MAYIWFRGHICDESETQSVMINQWMKLAYFFLEKCGGFTDGDEYVAGSGKSYVGNDVGSEIKTGTDGEFLTSTWDFQDTTANEFGGASPGDYLCVVDNTNRINSSVFQIKKVYSNSKVGINFKADIDNLEYPTAESSLTWYLIPKGYELPNTTNDYWRLQSPHTSNWAIQMSYNATTRIGVQIAVDGNWSGTRKLGGGTASADASFYIQDYGANRSHVLDLIVETTGKLFFLGDWNGYTQYGDYDHFGQMMVNEITPIDTIDNSYEKIALISPQQSDQGATHRGNAAGEFGYFRVWNEDEQQEITGYIADLATFSSSFNSEDSPLPVNPFHPIDVRSGGDGESIGKLVNYSGDVLVPDIQVTSRAFSFLGYTTEYLTTSALHTPYGGDIQVVNRQHWNGPLTLTKDSSKDWLHHGGGICLPWCGLTYRAYGG